MLRIFGNRRNWSNFFEKNTGPSLEEIGVNYEIMPVGFGHYVYKINIRKRGLDNKYTFLVFSDFHFRNKDISDILKAYLDYIENLGTIDAIIIAGDIIHDRFELLPYHISFLERLSQMSHYPSYVLGNHDIRKGNKYNVMSEMSRLGFNYLPKKTFSIGNLVIGGIDYLGELDRSIFGKDTSNWIIMHSNDSFTRAQFGDKNIDAIIFGHTHAGEVVIGRPPLQIDGTILLKINGEYHNLNSHIRGIKIFYNNDGTPFLSINNHGTEARLGIRIGTFPPGFTQVNIY